MVRHGAARAELTAEFVLDDAPAAADWLRAQELDEDGACQLRRTLRADGGSRAWINGRPATLGQLAELAAHLVEIHGQHEQQALLSRPSQLALLDAYGRHADLLAAVRAAAQECAALTRERTQLAGRGDVSERVAWLQYQLEELDREALAPEAIEALVAGHRRQAHVAELSAACDGALAALAGDGDGPALGAQLQRLRHSLQRQAGHEPRLSEADAMLESAAIQLDEAAALLERVRADLDLDPGTLEELDRRLARLHELARKHRVAPEALAGQRAALAAELEALRGADQRLAVLDREIARADAHWREAAGALTAARTASALLAELGMGGGRFQAALEPAAEPRPDPQGAERVEFLVAANPGQPARPLRKVASGGELSRISLAIEVAALGLDAVPTMIFDEVDSGIGGAVADIVGRKLRALGRARQALCVTHLPQVAAQGHAHYRVSKDSAGGVTRSAVEPLDPRQREEELARMLGGARVGAEARAAARALLAGADG
jgi:DNA repair protein RecN (Recombination protein N)